MANDRWGTGCVVGDFDNDGSPDLYVTNVGANRLYRNNHDGTFTDVAVKAGVALDDDSATVAIDHTGATFGDYDGDGNLDLFVAGYIDLDLKNASVLRLQGLRIRLLPISRREGDVRPPRPSGSARSSLP